MSGRGRFNRGAGSSGRGNGQNSGHGYRRNNHGNSNSNSKNNNKDEMKFVPHYVGKVQTKTYDTVRDHILQQIQKTFKFGGDIAAALKKDEPNYMTTNYNKPTRQTVSTSTLPTTKDENMQFTMK
ncbi:MAG: hypothetical protein AAF335_01365, partial [Bacteroidota bacterium]